MARRFEVRRWEMRDWRWLRWGAAVEVRWDGAWGFGLGSEVGCLLDDLS